MSILRLSNTYNFDKSRLKTDEDLNMNPSIKSAFSRAVLLGTDDASIETIPYEPVIDTQHVPLVLLRTEKGPEGITILPTSMFTSVYGDLSTETNGLYHNHQTEVLNAAARSGNSTIAVKRMLGESAVESKLRMYVKATVIEQATTEFTVVDKTPTVENVNYYELFSIAHNSKGPHGDEYGVSFLPADSKTQMLYSKRLNGFVYELRLFRRNPATNQRSLIYTNFNDEKAYFTFNPNTATMESNPYYLPNVINEMYGNEEDTKLNIFGKVTIFEDAFAALHLGLKENKLTTASNYWDYDILTAAKLIMAKELVYSFVGGKDGYNTAEENFVTMKINLLEEYDNLVYTYLSNLDEDDEISNIAKLPFSIVYDSGFSMRTKLALRKILGLRPDVVIGLSTFMVANHYEDVDGSTGFEYVYSNDQALAIATASALKTAFALYPESTVHGTATMRAFITIQSGLLPKSGYSGRQSIIIDLVEKLSRYMGAGISWNDQYAFDTSPINEVTDWINVNFTYRSEAMKETAWDAGVIWLENKDTTTLFYPAYQTIYPDDTSVLNNIFTVMACSYLNKVAHRVWANVTGNEKDSDEMIVARINDLIESETLGIFDGRFEITANTYFTPADNARGYSWTTEIEIYAHVSKTVGTYKITAHRMS